VEQKSRSSQTCARRYAGTFAALALALVALTLYATAAARAGAAAWCQVPLDSAVKEARKDLWLSDLVPFDGRLYLDVASTVRAEDPADLPPAEITCYDPETDEIKVEHKGKAKRFGRLRRLGDRLLVPEAAVAEGSAGYLVSEGGGKWKRFEVADGVTGIQDVVSFDGKMFAAGRGPNGALVAWRPEGEDEWKLIRLTSEAARWSPEAIRFFEVDKRLFLLAHRSPPKDVIGMAPPGWGPLYVLRYRPAGSERGFLFDGPPRPVAALHLMGPGGGMAAADAALGDVVPFGDETLYTITRQAGGMKQDNRYGLFRAHVQEALPWCGETVVAKAAAMPAARDVFVDGKVLYVLLSEGTEGRAKVAANRDMKDWRTVFDGTLPARPAAVAVLDGTVYVGLEDGRIGTLGE